MNIVEFEAKALLRDSGLPVPEGVVLGPEDPVPDDRPMVIKAQVPFGGRGKRGLVVRAAARDVRDAVSQIRKRMVDEGWSKPFVLLEQPVETVGETYLAWRIDDVAQGYSFCFAPSGGINVDNNPGALSQLPFAAARIPAAHDFIEFLQRLGFSGRTLTALCRFAVGSWRVFTQADAHLVEVNPLAITPRGDVIALDAKITVDDSAKSRHGEWSSLYSATLGPVGLTDLERQAAEGGLTFIELPGEVAVLSGGAGLGMALLDMLADAGMPAANFVDNSGGSPVSVSELRTRLVFERAARDDVKAILLYITVAASSIARHVRTIVAMLDRSPPPKPLVIGLLCGGAAEREMTFKEAQEIFTSRGYPCAKDLRGVMEALVRLRRSQD